MTTHVSPPARTDSVALLYADAASTQNFTVMETIRAKFLKTARDAHLSTAMGTLIANAVQRENTNLPPSFENRGRGSGLVLVGPTGVGKSKSLERYFNTHPVLAGYADPASASPLVSVSVPSPCTSMQLARALLRATGYALERDMAAHRLWEKAFDRLQAMRKFIVHFDEMQHVVHNMPEKDLQQMADTLKNAMYNRRITLILSGVATLVPFVQHDAQLFRRLAILPFEGITPEKHDDIRRMVGTYVNAAGLADFRRSEIDNADFIARLSRAALKAYGYSIVLTQLAIENALENGSDQLTNEHFATVFAKKTSFSADRNPFLAANWHMIDCAKMFEKAVEAPPPAPISRKRKAKS
ncbi:AAA domain-containing protein [Tardiphaga sp. OK246]|uniref:ATP-binding protein n=1 Tax=Tardiphaga sp. OK246 TaxID=1855307 RepID=UPI000B6C3F6F|nr:ATP-binding protein [Tardiphaga sp. OK246]SNT12566.1 AAA domain-containing protein [Tardiphaga sp. OK246]